MLFHLESINNTRFICFLFQGLSNVFLVVNKYGAEQDGVDWSGVELLRNRGN